MNIKQWREYATKYFYICHKRTPSKYELEEYVEIVKDLERFKSNYEEAAE